MKNQLFSVYDTLFNEETLVRKQRPSKDTKVNQSHYMPGEGPEGSRRLRFPDFKTISTGRR